MPALVEHIARYPIKGGYRNEPTGNIVLTPSGIVGDREFMIVRDTPEPDGHYPFVTQRDKRDDDDRPQGLADLAILRSHLTPDGVMSLTWGSSNGVISFLPQVDAFDGELEEVGIRDIPVRVHEDRLMAVDQGDFPAKWLSEKLQIGVRLVGFNPAVFRPASQTYLKNSNGLRFQDAYPAHLVSQTSVDKIAEEAGEPTPWTRYRPNIVVSGMEEGLEYTIDEGMIGDLPFINPKPSDRCPVTQVDQETGRLHAPHPLKELAMDNGWVNAKGQRKVVMGINLLPQAEGTISVGDPITVISFKKDDRIVRHGREI